MTEMNPDIRGYQAPGVYTTPDEQHVAILYGGHGAPNGPGHGHIIYNIPQDRTIYGRPPQ